MTKPCIDRCRKVMLTSFSAWLTLFPSLASSEHGRPLIFPEPKTMTVAGTGFALDDQTTIVLPSRASEQDLFLANFLRDEIGDRFALHLKTERIARLDGDRRLILIGSIANPLVKAYCT